MSKLKLNIQYFGSTNKTTHYDLSQYVASDKPTYLVDYNQDMAKIDAGIYGAMSKATVNEANIGTMQDLTTSAKSSLVLAINEINTQLGTNTTNIGINTSNIATLGTNQGDLVNLMTVAKNNLVSAINELKGVNDTQNTEIAEAKSNIEKFNLNVFKTYGTSEVTVSDGTMTGGQITVATNSDYSIMKVYGKVNINSNNGVWNTSITLPNVIPEAYRPESDITVSPCGVPITDSSSTSKYLEASIIQLIIRSNGNITISFNKGTNIQLTYALILIPFVIFVKNFGDTPEPSN